MSGKRNGSEVLLFLVVKLVLTTTKNRGYLDRGIRGLGRCGVACGTFSTPGDIVSDLDLVSLSLFAALPLVGFGIAGDGVRLGIPLQRSTEPQGDVGQVAGRQGLVCLLYTSDAADE